MRVKGWDTLSIFIQNIFFFVSHIQLCVFPSKRPEAHPSELPPKTLKKHEKLLSKFHYSWFVFWENVCWIISQKLQTSMSWWFWFMSLNIDEYGFEVKETY